MNHNDINRQCAEAMGWKSQEETNDTCPMFWITRGSVVYIETEGGQLNFYDFRTDWNAMKLLKEYANDHDFALCLSEGTKGSCCAEFVSRKEHGGYFCDYADTFTEAAAKAFRKCFGKEE